MKKKYMKPAVAESFVEATSMIAVSGRLGVSSTTVNNMVGDVNMQEFTDIWGN